MLDLTNDQRHLLTDVPKQSESGPPVIYRVCVATLLVDHLLTTSDPLAPVILIFGRPMPHQWATGHGIYTQMII